MSITDRIRYGAAELTAAYNRHLLLALVVSIAVHGAAIGLFLSTSRPAAATPESTGPRRLDTIRIFLDNPPVLPPIEAPTSRGTADRVARTGGSGREVKRVAGAAPVVVEDPAVADESAFPTIDEITKAGQHGAVDGDVDGGERGDGDGLDAEGTSNPGSAPRPDTVLDATSVYYFDVDLPTVDMGQLMANVAYPEIARRNDIQGTVQIKALIGVDGAVERVMIAASANRILDDAAIEAVRRTRFGTARQNSVPVRVWIQIPITFRLD